MIRRNRTTLPYNTPKSHLAVVLFSALAVISIGQHAQAQIAFSSSRDAHLDIYVMDNHRSTDSAPVWSPDGKRIAFDSLLDELRNTDRNWEIYVMGADGGNLINLTQHPQTDPWPTWSLNGKPIAFASNRDGDIYVMNDAGGNMTRLTHDDDESKSFQKYVPLQP